MGTELDFDDADISFRHEVGPAGRPQGTFRARILRPRPGPDGLPVNAFTGRWLSDRGIIVTAITLPAFRVATTR